MTLLQQAAQSLIKVFRSTGKPIDPYIEQLHKALETELTSQSTSQELAEWMTKGETLIEGKNNGVLFALGGWWADRPWRT